MKYSFIVPVYNRPDEVDELLESLTRQAITDFEVIVVEDGSAIPCHDVCEKYRGLLNLHYFYKEQLIRYFPLHNTLYYSHQEVHFY